MQLHEIESPRGSRKTKRIIGRGPGSGRGKTAGRGENGQRSRAGRWVVGGSEGGQMPLIRRLPKVGFRSHRPVLYQVVNVERLNDFEDGTIISPEELRKAGIISSLGKPVKILATGELKKKLTVKVEKVSKAAEEKITKAGGTVEIFDKNEQSEKETIKE